MRRMPQKGQDHPEPLIELCPASPDAQTQCSGRELELEYEELVPLRRTNQCRDGEERCHDTGERRLDLDQYQDLDRRLDLDLGLDDDDGHQERYLLLCRDWCQESEQCSEYNQRRDGERCRDCKQRWEREWRQEGKQYNGAGR
ncbi:hypothetical protein UY3_04915 [Chelonia mydas]|uniref:Uncharacterized protein n=1 Tax=Chelonia mydas TaxID=8469 RepID=M7BQ79_CHEMY|nr:hypothetical protein UY3_04915 [Chelonia mydas]